MFPCMPLLCAPALLRAWHVVSIWDRQFCGGWTAGAIPRRHWRLALCFRHWPQESRAHRDVRARAAAGVHNFVCVSRPPAGAACVPCCARRAMFTDRRSWRHAGQPAGGARPHAGGLRVRSGPVCMVSGVVVVDGAIVAQTTLGSSCGPTSSSPPKRVLYSQ
eukprot:1279812-Prymnesium_polylepis.1